MKPLNPRIKIRPNGRPYIETADLVASKLERLTVTDPKHLENERSRGEEVERAVIELERAVIDAAIQHRDLRQTYEAYTFEDLSFDRAVDALKKERTRLSIMTLLE